MTTATPIQAQRKIKMTVGWTSRSGTTNQSHIHLQNWNTWHREDDCAVIADFKKSDHNGIRRAVAFLVAANRANENPSDLLSRLVLKPYDRSDEMVRLCLTGRREFNVSRAAYFAGQLSILNRISRNKKSWKTSPKRK